MSSIARDTTNCQQIIQNEKNIFNEFKQTFNTKQWLLHKLETVNTDLFLMSQGRHLGLSCRLIDWTASYDVASYFASFDERNVDVDGCIWSMLLPSDYFSNTKYTKYSPLQDSTDVLRVVKEDCLVDNSIDFPEPLRRQFSQRGYFAYTNNDNICSPLNELTLENIEIQLVCTITPKTKKGIKKRLQHMEKYLSNIRPNETVLTINNKYLI